MKQGIKDEKDYDITVSDSLIHRYQKDLKMQNFIFTQLLARKKQIMTGKGNVNLDYFNYKKLSNREAFRFIAAEMKSITGKLSSYFSKEKDMIRLIKEIEDKIEGDKFRIKSAKKSLKNLQN